MAKILPNIKEDNHIQIAKESLNRANLQFTEAINYYNKFKDSETKFSPEQIIKFNKIKGWQKRVVKIIKELPDYGK